MDSHIRALTRLLGSATRIVVLTGAGVSAESGIPTFRGEGGLWRRFRAEHVANPSAWAENKGLVWEFYNYRRTLMRSKTPNAAHMALATFERRCSESGRVFDLVTQNVDDLHLVAGSKRVTRLHGSIWRIKCDLCCKEMDNHDVPIMPAFEGRDGPDRPDSWHHYAPEDFPRCSEPRCHGFMRPAVVWFGESLNSEVFQHAEETARLADVFLVVGTSLEVHPAASLSDIARHHGAKCAEINLDRTPSTLFMDYTLQGRAGDLLPKVLDPVAFV